MADTQATVRSSSAARVLAAAIGLLALAACASVEDACLRDGFTAGTTAFDQCVADKRAEHPKYTGRSGGRGWGGPGGGGL